MSTYEKLLDVLVRDGYLKSPFLIEAFRAVDRAPFVPEAVRAEAYENYPLPIGGGQTISQPLTVAFALELLSPVKGDHVLDVGCGSGWQAALLAHLVGKQGKIIGVERVGKLVARARSAITAALPEELRDVVTVLHADATDGYPAGGPYDRIIAAATSSTVPEAWKDQLVVGGRIVAPVGDSLVLLEKIGPGEFTERQFHGFRFVPLVEGLA